MSAALSAAVRSSRLACSLPRGAARAAAAIRAKEAICINIVTSCF